MGAHPALEAPGTGGHTQFELTMSHRTIRGCPLRRAGLCQGRFGDASLQKEARPDAALRTAMASFPRLTSMMFHNKRFGCFEGVSKCFIMLNVLKFGRRSGPLEICGGTGEDTCICNLELGLGSHPPRAAGLDDVGFVCVSPKLRHRLQ